jgi:DNA-binding MarR family transcriptional regulator
MSKTGSSKTGSAKRRDPRLTTGLLHDAFGHLFRRCHLRSQQAFARAFEACDGDLSPLQFGILELVQLNPGISHGALAEGMVTAPSVVTTAMKPLRAAGHVVLEETSGGDARRRGYRLSQKGDALISSASWAVMVAEGILVGPLSEAERDTLKRLLQRLAASGRL